MRVHIKSKYGADFRRYSIVIGTGLPYPTLDEFTQELYNIHKLTEEQRQSTTIGYTDKDGSILPITNDDNLRKALDLQIQLRILVRNLGESYEEQFGYGLTSKSIEEKKKRAVSISTPQDFRRVSSILDADILPRELRRVQLCKTYTNKPLGFYIRDRSSEYWTPQGLVVHKGIFISRLLAEGLAASTNLLNVDDEVLEVNGIDLAGKSIDQVTDIMLANAANMILTIRPAEHHRHSDGYTYIPPLYSETPIGFRQKTLPLPPPYIPRQPVYYGVYGGHPDFVENYRMSLPFSLPSAFSRHSTYRLSEDQLKKNSLLRNRHSPQRPLSMHPGWMYPSSPYGMGY